jgi:di/tricarboxylate transporter
VFGLPAVQAVINYKWHTWAKKFLLYELVCYLAWLAGYTAFTLLFQQEVKGRIVLFRSTCTRALSVMRMSSDS